MSLITDPNAGNPCDTLDHSNDFVCLKALCTNLDPACRTTNYSLDRLKVGHKRALGARCARGPLTGVNVTDVLASHGSLAAYGANICHFRENSSFAFAVQ